MTKEFQEQTQIAVMATDIAYIKDDIKSIKKGFEVFPGIYLTQKDHLEFVQAVEKRFTLIEAQSFFKTYVLPIVYVALGAVTTVLVTSYLQNLK